MKDNIKSAAFTLIELAICLLVISLSGIIIGDELITQAKIRGTVGQYTLFSSSIYNFNAKYNALPGDISNATDF